MEMLTLTGTGAETLTDLIALMTSISHVRGGTAPQNAFGALSDSGVFCPRAPDGSVLQMDSSIVANISRDYSCAPSKSVSPCLGLCPPDDV